MELVINGEPRSAQSQATLRELVAVLGLKEDRVAIELNGHIVRRDRWDGTLLQSGDRLEIVQFVGGG